MDVKKCGGNVKWQDNPPQGTYVSDMKDVVMSGLNKDGTVATDAEGGKTRMRRRRLTR